MNFPQKSPYCQYFKAYPKICSHSSEVLTITLWCIQVNTDLSNMINFSNKSWHNIWLTSEVDFEIWFGNIGENEISKKYWPLIVRTLKHPKQYSDPCPCWLCSRLRLARGLENNVIFCQHDDLWPFAPLWLTCNWFSCQRCAKVKRSS